MERTNRGGKQDSNRLRLSGSDQILRIPSLYRSATVWIGSAMSRSAPLLVKSMLTIDLETSGLVEARTPCMFTLCALCFKHTSVPNDFPRTMLPYRMGLQSHSGKTLITKGKLKDPCCPFEEFKFNSEASHEP